MWDSCLEGVGRLYEEYGKAVCRVCEGCLEGMERLSGGYGKVLGDLGSKRLSEGYLEGVGRLCGVYVDRVGWGGGGCDIWKLWEGCF